jgi:hypothetical protein
VNVPVIRQFDDPDEQRTFEFGHVDLVRIDGMALGRAQYEPGWRWSTHVGALTGERLCWVAHVGYVLAGRNLITMKDGSRLELQPGDLFSIPPGHDSEVVGLEPYESLHLMGTEEYAHAAAPPGSKGAA